METVTLDIADETLRDGEQQAGVFFKPEIKRHLAHLSATTGIQQIAMMPSIHPTEADLFQQLIAEGLGNYLAASTLMGQRFIDQSRSCGAKQVILFYGLSDRLLLLRDPSIKTQLPKELGTLATVPPSLIQQARENAIAKILENLHYANSLGLKVWFAAEDSSRADFDFLVDCIRQFQPMIESFLLCDTTGSLTPEKSYIWVRNLLEYTHNAHLTVHFHNDLGLALENTIQAVMAGAKGVSGTFAGIGERAGNVALEQVLNGLRLRFGWEVAGINYDALQNVTDYLEQLNIRPYAPYSQQAQWCETGIHVHAWLRDRVSYSTLNYGQPDIWFGKHSGASNFRYLFEQYLHHPLNQTQYEQLREQVKNLSVQQQRCFSTAEVLTFLEQGILKLE